VKKISLSLFILPGFLIAGGTMPDDIHGLNIYGYFHAGQESTTNNYYKTLTTEEQSALTPMVQCMVAESKLKNGNYAEGFKLFENRLTVDNGRDGNTRGKRLTNPWDGSHPKDKNITVITEGGFGDVMSFFLPYVETLQKQGGHVTFALSGGHKRLKKLFEEHSTLKELGVSIIEVDDKAAITTGDCQVYLMSLPQYLSVDPTTGESCLQGISSVNTIPRNPIIKIHDAAVGYWADRLPKDMFIVALCHGASKLPPGQHDRGLDRSVPLNVLIPAICNKLGKENVLILNLLQKFNPVVAKSMLQKEQNKRTEEAKTKGKTVEPSKTVDQEDILDDEYMTVLLDPCKISKDFEKEPFVDTGAIITVLSDADYSCPGAVGSVDTSVINLAGLVVAGRQKNGVRAGCFLSETHDWRWGTENQTPWFPELTLFIQEHRGDWKPVANNFANWLAEWYKKATPKPAGSCIIG
jgi:predicted ribosome-associated RNA-binding protein Tma20